MAKHFPGHGGSDRLPDEEVATVDKLLEELAQIELSPFFTVTDLTRGDEGMTDALMSSHIRYRGIQGDVRQYTAPISFAPDGMGAILEMPEFSQWRVDGLMVSDSLGVPAVRKYFDPTLSTFPHRRIAKEAFLAGNDLLLLSEFDLDNVWAQQFRNIRDTIAFFREEYQSNPQFAARVDEAVIRILRLKLELYPEFTLAAVQVHPTAALQVCGLGLEVTQRIANQAITLLYPDANAQPAAPRRGEKLVIFTDSRPVRECFTDQCPTFSPLSQTAVEEAIVRIYGPGGTGQISREDITSLPFGQLIKHLAGEETEQPIGPLLEDADWILFAATGSESGQRTQFGALKQFLNMGLAPSTMRGWWCWLLTRPTIWIRPRSRSWTCTCGLWQDGALCDGCGAGLVWRIGAPRRIAGGCGGGELFAAQAAIGRSPARDPSDPFGTHGGPDPGGPRKRTVAGRTDLGSQWVWGGRWHAGYLPRRVSGWHLFASPRGRDGGGTGRDDLSPQRIRRGKVLGGKRRGAPVQSAHRVDEPRAHFFARPYKGTAPHGSRWDR